MAAAQQLGRAGHEVHVYERESQAGRPAALRHSRLQDGEELHRPPRRADAGRGRDLPLRRQCRRRQARSTSCSPSTMPCSIAAAPRRRAMPAFRAPISPACMTRCPIWCSRTAASAARTSTVVGWPSRSDPCRRQACRRRRRRRYRVRLRRHGLPPGRGAGHPARHPPAAAGEGRQARRLALLGDQDAHLVLAGRRRRARVPGGDARIRRRRRHADRRQVLRGRREAASRSPARNSSSGRSRLHRHRLLPARSPTAC